LIYQNRVYIKAVINGEIVSEKSYTKDELDAWTNADYTVIAVLLVLWCYFLAIEIK